MLKLKVVIIQLNNYIKNTYPIFPLKLKRSRGRFDCRIGADLIGSGARQAEPSPGPGHVHHRGRGLRPQLLHRLQGPRSCRCRSVFARIINLHTFIIQWRLSGNVIVVNIKIINHVLISNFYTRMVAH